MKQQLKRSILTSFSWVPDKIYLSVLFAYRIHARLNWQNPTTFNEKIQWLKIHDRKPEYVRMVDKIEAKKIVEKALGSSVIVPTIGEYSRFEDINFDELPNQFVIKCTHDSGGVVVCKDKRTFSIKNARNIITSSLRRNYYDFEREWPYKNVKPRILIEKYIEDPKTQELRDYKFFCFDGIVKAMYIASDRQKKGEETKFDFFTDAFEHIPVQNAHPTSEVLPDKPTQFDQMKRFAETLSKGVPLLRVDFFEANGHIYFSELTFYHMSGLSPFVPKKWDLIFGSWIDLSKVHE